ncbi:MAG: agmatinase [Elusimicrobia bacterium]|nr:agmatinase [Elusimicrobiota bacterium]
MSFKHYKKQFIYEEYAPLEKAAFVIFPVPYEMTVSYGSGTAKGPDAVIESSLQLELYDEEAGFEIWKKGFFTCEPFKYVKNEKEFFPKMEKAVEELLSSTEAFPFFIGGEHSVSQALIPPFAKKYKNLSVLHFDAHADLRPAYQGSAHSHASALYPISRTNKVVQVGIRSIGIDEKKFVNCGNVKTFLMHENLEIDKLIKKVLAELTDTVYLTIDVDGFDPSVMPGTGTPQPGGFGWYEALKLFKAVCLNKKVVGCDVVEVAPIKGSPITEFNAAKLIYRLAGYLSK